MRWASNPPCKNNIATETQAIHYESHQTLGAEPRTEAAMPCMMSIGMKSERKFLLRWSLWQNPNI